MEQDQTNLKTIEGETVADEKFSVGFIAYETVAMDMHLALEPAFHAIKHIAKMCPTEIKMDDLSLLAMAINDQVSMFGITAKLSAGPEGELILAFTDTGDGSAQVLTKMLAA